MIEKVSAFRVGQQVFNTIEEAQKSEILIVIFGVKPGFYPEEEKKIADAIIANADKIVDILTMKPTSRPRARKTNGATRTPRKARVPAAPAPGSTAQTA